MKKTIVILCFLICILTLTACNNSSGPNENALRPLETEPSTQNHSIDEYERQDSIVIHQEKLNSGTIFEL